MYSTNPKDTLITNGMAEDMDTALNTEMATSVALDIGARGPKDSTNVLNGMVCTTINKASDSFMATALNYGNIRGRNSGNSGTSSGTSGMEISVPPTAQRMAPPATAGTTTINSFTRTIRFETGPLLDTEKARFLARR